MWEEETAAQLRRGDRRRRGALASEARAREQGGAFWFRGLPGRRTYIGEKRVLFVAQRLTAYETNCKNRGFRENKSTLPNRFSYDDFLLY